MELAAGGPHEHAELVAIYVGRGLDAVLADQVATQLMAKDALGAHARDELGISDTLSARPVQAALASAATFAVGAAMPLLLVLVVPTSALVWTVSGSSLFFLALLGSLAARVGGSSVLSATVRVTFWGALAMTLTAGVRRIVWGDFVRRISAIEESPKHVLLRTVPGVMAPAFTRHLSTHRAGAAPR